MNLFVLVLALLLPTGEMELMIRTENGKTKVYKDEKSCKADLEADKKAYTPELEKAGVLFEFNCVPKHEVDKALGVKGERGA